MAEFKRGMDKLIESLSTNDLFQNKLKPDIDDGKVFFAIRYGKGSFYLRGCSLFTYDNSEFTTHYKFGFVPSAVGNTYITETDLKSMAVIDNFKDGYKQIKERVALYAEPEADGVSALYAFAPRATNKEGRFFLVDIEVAFDAKNDVENSDGDKKAGRKTDRIDILLYDNCKRQLLFCEAKHFSNAEIRERDGESPEVINQLKKYDRQITAKKSEIIAQYKKAFREYNELMGTELNDPEGVFDKCGLYIFGFNRKQQKELRNRMDANNEFYGRKCRIIGNTRNDSMEEIFKALT